MSKIKDLCAETPSANYQKDRDDKALTAQGMKVWLLCIDYDMTLHSSPQVDSVYSSQEKAQEALSALRKEWGSVEINSKIAWMIVI